MSFRFKGLVAAMEEEQQEETVTDMEMVPSSQAEVESNTAELIETTTAVEEMLAATDDAASDAEALQDIHDIMGESVEKGEGLTEDAAQMAEVAVESICARLGMKGRVMPSMESFGSRASRVTSTRVAMETVGEKIKNIWKAIISGLKRVWEMVSSFFGKLSKSRDALEKNLVGLKARLGKVADGATPQKDKLQGSFAGAFTIGDSASLETAKKIIKCSMDLVAVSENTAKTIISAPSQNMDAHELVEIFEKNCVKLGKVTYSGPRHDSPDITEVNAYGTFVDGKCLVVTVNKPGATGVSFVVTPNVKEKAKEIEALNSGAITVLLDEAIDLIKEIKGYDKISKDLSKATKAAVTMAESLSKMVSKVSDGSEEEKKSDAPKIETARMISSYINKMGSLLPATSYQAAKAANDYASACISNLK